MEFNLGMGTMYAFFQSEGQVQVEIEELNIRDRGERWSEQCDVA